MRILISAAATAIAALVLVGCHADTKKPVASPTPVATAPAAAAAQAPANPAAELSQAFIAAFGSPSPAVRIVTRDGQETTLRYRPAKLIPLGDVSALISEARTDGCHGCYGEPAVHYLAPEAAGWRVVGAWPEIADGGSFGEPPSWSLRSDLFSGPALVARAGGTWQGCTVDYADIIELTPERPIVRAKRVLMIYDDDSNPDRGVEGTLRPEQRDRAFSVDYAGDHPRKVEYRLSGEVFDASRGAPGLPSC